MELDELQELWNGMSQKIDQQKLLTDKIILQMTQQRYSNKFQTVSTVETIGAVICLLFALGILVNIGKLDTWYLMACGLFTLGFMVIVPTLVLRSLYRIKRLDISKRSFKDTFVVYTKAKKNLMSLQKVGILASFFIAFTTVPVAIKIMDGVDMFQTELRGWQIGFIAIMLIFLFFFARWGYGCYVSITKSAESILKELDND